MPSHTGIPTFSCCTASVDVTSKTGKHAKLLPSFPTNNVYQPLPYHALPPSPLPSMTPANAEPPEPTPPSLSPSALYAPQPPPHHDSEEFLASDRHRTAQELGEIIHDRAQLSSREPSLHSASTRPSQISTATDISGPDAHRRLRLRRQKPRWYDGLVSFWARNVSVTIGEGAHRDHLALERTFLGYLRTSLALAMTGVVTAQLFRLQHAVAPDPRIGFFVLGTTCPGTPLAASFIALGMLLLLIGALRFWRQQAALVRGKVWAGGWEIVAIMGLSLLITVVMFVMLVWVDVDKG